MEVNEYENQVREGENIKLIFGDTICCIRKCPNALWFSYSIVVYYKIWYEFIENLGTNEVLIYPFVHIFLNFIEFISLNPQKIGLVMRYSENMKKVILQGLFNQSHLKFDVRKFQFNLEVSNLPYKDIASMQLNFFFWQTCWRAFID